MKSVHFLEMARIVRMVVGGMPHHIAQRGNRRQTTFFSDEDYAAYIALMGEWCLKHALDMGLLLDAESYPSDCRS